MIVSAGRLITSSRDRKKDSIFIDNKGYTFLENKHSIRDVWSVLVQPMDTIQFKSTDQTHAYNSFYVRSLSSDQRTSDLNFYVAYNKWKEDTKIFRLI